MAREAQVDIEMILVPVDQVRWAALQAAGLFVQSDELLALLALDRVPGLEQERILKLGLGNWIFRGFFLRVLSGIMGHIFVGCFFWCFFVLCLGIVLVLILLVLGYDVADLLLNVQV